MPDLPHGWRMRNSEGELKGPPAERDDFDFEGGSDYGSDGEVDIRPDSPGWEDMEDDTEAVTIKSLLDDTTFSSVDLMLEHCVAKYDFDFRSVVRQHKLDFYGAIKLVNYIRAQVQISKDKPAVDDPKLWEDDKYLQPTLPDDALLFNLDDVVDADEGAEKESK